MTITRIDKKNLPLDEIRFNIPKYLSKEMMCGSYLLNDTYHDWNTYNTMEIYFTDCDEFAGFVDHINRLYKSLLRQLDKE